MTTVDALCHAQELYTEAVKKYLKKQKVLLTLNLWKHDLEHNHKAADESNYQFQWLVTLEGKVDLAQSIVEEADFKHFYQSSKSSTFNGKITLCPVSNYQEHYKPAITEGRGKVDPKNPDELTIYDLTSDGVWKVQLQFVQDRAIRKLTGVKLTHDSSEHPAMTENLLLTLQHRHSLQFNMSLRVPFSL